MDGWMYSGPVAQQGLDSEDRWEAAMEASEGTGSPAPHPPGDSSLKDRAARGETTDSANPATLHEGMLLEC